MPYSPVFILAIACFFGMSPWFSVAVIGAQIQQQFGITSDQLIELALAVQFGFVAGALISAFFNLADIVGPRKLVIVGAAAAALSNLFPLIIPTYAGFFTARFLTGASLALLYPASLKLMSTWVQTRRGTALGILLGGLTLGTSAPHLLRAAGTLVHLDWTFVLLGTSAFAAGGGLIVMCWARQGPYPFPSAPFNPYLIASILRERRLRLIAIGYFGHMWELYAMWFWFPAFMRTRMQEQGVMHFESYSSLYTAVAIGTGAIGCWLGGWWGDRVSRIHAARMSLMISGTSALLIGWSGVPFWLILILGVIWGLSVNADSAQFSTLTSTYADKHYVGTTLTLQLATGFLLTGITIKSVPHWATHFGWGVSLGVLALGPLIGSIALSMLDRDVRRDHVAT